jgi:hypothetical protein
MNPMPVLRKLEDAAKEAELKKLQHALAKSNKQGKAESSPAK